MNVRPYVFLVLFLMLACDGSPSADRVQQAPALEAPEAGLDDPTAYEGYATRFFRDSRGNTFQIYLDGRRGRVVHIWGDAVNESAAFTVRDAEGRPAPVAWGGHGATAEDNGAGRGMRHRLAAAVGTIEIGWFLLGTMRQERDFQYMEWGTRPYGDPPFLLPELVGLIDRLDRLPAEERERHLSALGATGVEDLRSRLEPQVTLSEDADSWTLRVEQTSLDARNRLTMELSGNVDTSSATLLDDRLSVRARSGERIELDVRVATDSEPLTPLGRERLFNDVFEEYYARQQRAADSLRAALGAENTAADSRVLSFRRLERQVRGLELLASEEKLMASMPNYATYFGRDQMMSALMLEPISSIDLQELVIASVLRKIDPSGNVSHEEALGGQAIREAAAEYIGYLRTWEDTRERDPDGATEALTRARQLLEDPQAVRENYHMVDDDFQLPVLVDRYLSRADVPKERKRSFLSSPAGGHLSPGDPTGQGESRLDALVRNLAFATELALPYALEPESANLVGFFREDEAGWLPGSWRDSRAGYGNGRFAMDVNVVWVPRALESVEGILEAVDTLGLSLPDALSDLPFDAPALESFLTDRSNLRAAIETWRTARGHFEVDLAPDEIGQRVTELLGTLPEAEAEYWRASLARERGAGADRPLSFLALSLNGEGRPVAAVNTDPATELFLGDHTEEILEAKTDPATVLSLIDAIMRPYPAGLFVEGLGPVVVNDAYADDTVQRRFREDLYHSPRAVWGREVNLLLLGLARQIGAAYDPSGRLREQSEAFSPYVEELRHALETTRAAVEASGLGHNELWSYRIEDDALRPVRYGTSSDIQLWNVTDLAVGFLLDRLPHP